MEGHKLVSRFVINKGRITVEYAITSYGKTLEDVIFTLLHWGLQHRKEITGKNNLQIPVTDYIYNMKNNLPCEVSYPARNQ
jgi:DNA-binding HxlR family transcriptional regulator